MKKSYLFVLYLLVASAVPAEGQEAPTLPSATLERGGRVALLSGKNLPVAARLARDDLVSYLQRSLGAIVHIYEGDTRRAHLDESTCIVFGTRDENSAIADLERAGFALSTAGLGREGCRVKAGSVDSRLVIALTGETLTGASHGVYSFLENELGVGFFIDGDRVPHLESVNLEGLDRTERPAVPIRGLFYHPTWKHPHANSWRLWNFDGWQRAIDWMRRKRFNLLPLMHDSGGYLWGDVIFEAFPEIPQNDTTLAQFVVDPTWRRELNQRIFAYARHSGINIAYNLFYSQVPEFFARHYPQLEYHELNMANVGINANQPECRQVMRRYWKAILDTYGLDRSHIYLVCSYRHERLLREGYKNKNETTIAAWEILRELDPAAKMYVETWCWKYRDEEIKTRKTLDDNAILEWRDFDQGVPREIGVVEWDVRRMHPDGFPRGFNGRPFIQLTHSNMEGWWPPNAHRNHPRWLMDYFGESMDNGAEGVLFFHIQADTNEIIADLAASIGWQRQSDVKKFYQSYARRRFGREAADVLAESLSLLCDAVDYGPNRQLSPFPEMMHPLAPPAFLGSAEDYLANCEEQGEARAEWIRTRLDVFRSRRNTAAQAMLLARSMARRLKGEPFYEEYLWELDYVAARYEGIESMYAAHLLAGTDPTRAALLFDRALNAFHAVKELFRDQQGIRMSEIRKLEPEVPYTAAFLEDWETRGFWGPKVQSFHVIWERFDHFENLIRAMRPRGRG